MARNESTTVALVWIGFVMAISHGWLTNVRTWVTDKTHGPSGSSNPVPIPDMNNTANDLLNQRQVGRAVPEGTIKTSQRGNVITNSYGP